MKKGLGLALLGLAATGIGSRASAQPAHDAPAEPETAFEGHLLRITASGSSRVVDIGCTGRSALRNGNKLLVVCGTEGVVEVDLSDPNSPRRAGAMHVDGDATGLFLRDGSVWVEVAHVDARPVRIETPGPLPVLPRATQERTVTTPNDTLPRLPPSAPAAAPENLPGDAPKESPSMIAPPRRGDLWELALATGAFVAFGTLGGGVLGSASVAYRFESPFVLRAAMTPFGIAGPSTTTSSSPPVPLGGSGGFSGPSTSKGGTITVFGAHLLLGLDTQFVEVGLGLGGATVNQTFGNGFGPSPRGTPDTGAVSVVEAARIGARDGLALNVESSAVAANSQFDLGYFVTSVQIPVSKTAMLVLRGGGGRVGFAYGDIGVRVLVRGEGGKGTVALTGFAGGAGIMVNLCSSNPDPPFATSCNSSNLSGPALGGAVEWRL